MKVLIIGGTKFIGKAIVQHCLKNGHEVFLFNRGQEDPTSKLLAFRGDVDNLPRYTNELRGLKPDVIVHCIAYTEKHARDYVEVFQGLDAQTIVLGSQDCYEAFRQLNQGKEVSDYPIREEDQLSTVKYYWKGSAHVLADTYDKNLMTNIFLAAHERGALKSVVFRLPMVYGPGEPQLKMRHGTILRRIFDRRKVFLMGQLSQARVWTFGFVDNVAAAIVHAFGKEAVLGRIYNIGETQVRSWRRWAELYAAHAGWDFRFEIVPDEVIEGNPADRNTPPQHMIVDCTRYRIETGFQQPVLLRAQIKRTLNWAISHPQTLGDKPNYTIEDSILKSYLAQLAKQESPLVRQSS